MSPCGKGKSAKRAAKSPENTQELMNCTEIHAKAVEKYDALPDAEKTSSKCILICWDVVEELGAQTASTFTGSQSLGLPLIPEAVLEVVNYWMTLMGLDEKGTLEDEANDAFCPEYMTNILRRGRTLYAVYSKHLGMKNMRNWESRYRIETPNEDIVDFCFNLGQLCVSREDLEEFLTTDVGTFHEIRLLDEDQVETLICEGNHERFADEDIKKASEHAQKIATFMKKINIGK